MIGQIKPISAKHINNWNFPTIQHLSLSIYFNNNNNNCKTSIVPISSKRIELSGSPSIGAGQTHSPGTMQSSSTNDQMEWKLRKDKKV